MPTTTKKIGSAQPPKRRLNASAAAAIIVLVGAAAYFNSFSGALVFDDQTIRDNSTIRDLWSIDIFRPPGNGAPVEGRPMVNASLALCYAIGGDPALARSDLFAYHLFNLLVHLSAALALFGVVRRTLTLPRLVARFGDAATPLALAVSLIWTVHPLQTESVTYIVQRAESMAGLFYLLTLYCVIRASQPNRGVWPIAAVLACAAGMASKEIMVTAPLAAMLYDRIFLTGSWRRTFRDRWFLYLCLAATWGILISLVMGAGTRGNTAGFGMSGVSPLEYARSEPGVILHYLRLVFWPLGLCLDYAWPVARTAGEILPGLIVVGTLLAATVWALVRRPAWGFVGAWFFLILAPTSSFMPIADLAFEHRMYLPLASVATLAVIGTYLLIGRQARKIAAVGAMAILVTLGVLTHQRNTDYYSELAIWGDTLKNAPLNPGVRISYALALADKGQCDQALAELAKVIEQKPDCAAAYSNRGNIHTRMGQYEQAFREFARAIELKPDYAIAYNNRGNAYAARGQDNQAVKDFTRAVELNSDYAPAYNNRGNAYENIGRHDEAFADFARAIEADPDYAAAYSNRGNAYARKGQYGEAIGDFTRAIELNPDFALAYNNRGNAYVTIKQYDQAVKDFTRAIELDPHYAPAYHNRAVTYYYMKDYDKAWGDIKMNRKNGGTPNPAFVDALAKASGSPGEP